MKHTTSRALVFGFVLAALVGGGSLAGRVEQTAPAPDVMSALLNEVRGLRAALEQMATAGPRVQLALGRVQLQEQRIATQIRRLDAVKVSLLVAQRELEPLEKQAKEVAQFLREYPNSEGVREDEKKLADIKAELAKRHGEVQRLLIEESFLAQDISAEQNRWTDFNQRLEELERALARR